MSENQHQNDILTAARMIQDLIRMTRYECSVEAIELIISSQLTPNRDSK